MPDTPRYGRRRIDRMLREWQALRRAVASEGSPTVQAAFDACEEWVDFAFQNAGGGAVLAEAEAHRMRAGRAHIGAPPKKVRIPHFSA